MSAMNEIPITPLFTKSLAMIDDLANKLQNNQPITSSKSSEKKVQQKKEQKPKQQQPPKKAAAKPTHPFHQTFLVVAQVESIEKHPESEKLYKITLNIGGDEKKGLVAGLRKFYTETELLNRKLISIVNLKPKKLAGVLSEAMILAGTAVGDENNVKILDPSPNAQVGDRVVLSTDVNIIEPYVQSIEDRCSPNQWEKIVKELKVINGQPSVSGTTLTLLDGSIIKCELPDGSEIH
ncbi:predicted protein [Naegleria gruberi]|uniref:Predicted protein n=1 Tax=Naegleria gruberi TaxID=5762 RepID=D2W433_NAEGR|nr:uncharacterized protein NAEGRDRAFT_76163 [Naegleria gruberi]EFC36173.1 predicted protein [Naegleria gruberi]|eukprot:XP_002668917.1 predicted protein [Naegleria gruberi strain NEG-M]